MTSEVVESTLRGIIRTEDTVEIFIGIVVVIAAGIGLLWWINLRNPGTFGSKETDAQNQMEQRKDWGPR